MVTRYVDGTAGNDAWNGLAPTWDGVNGPKATLTAMEATPVVAGDLIHVRSGVYRETLTCGVSGAAGSAIEYRGDYAGLIWAGGGVVRITGSDDDKSATRANCITATTKSYRTFSGFVMDTVTGVLANLVTNCTYITIDRCTLYGVFNQAMISSTGATQSSLAVSNCAFWAPRSALAISVFHTSTANDVAHVISNCIILSAPNGVGVAISRVGGITVKNCFVWGAGMGVVVSAALAAGQTETVNNCIFYGCNIALIATALGEITENYNDLYANSTDRTNVGTGANSLAYPPLFDSRWFFELVNAGRMLSPFDLASYSQLVNVAGTSPTATDMRGTAAIGGVREWGGLEYDSTLKIAGGTGGAVRILPLRGSIG